MNKIKRAFVVIALVGFGYLTNTHCAMELCIPDSPLHHATREKNALCVARLLQINTDPNIVDDDGRTPFYYACMDPLSENPAEREAQLEIIRLLYCAGSDDLAITYFTLCDKPDILKAILLADRQLTAQSAVKHHDIAHALSPHPLKTRIRKQIKQPVKKLLHGAGIGNMSYVILALYLDVDVNAKNPENDSGNTALHKAATYNQQNMLQLLLDCQANINAQDNKGDTPLHKATDRHRDHVDIVRLLLKYNADSNIQNTSGQTPLHYTTLFPNPVPQIAELLLNHRANGNIQDKNGETPVYTATRWKHSATVPLLLAAGVDKNTPNRQGTAAADLANYSNCPDIYAQFHKEQPCVVS